MGLTNSLTGSARSSPTTASQAPIAPKTARGPRTTSKQREIGLVVAARQNPMDGAIGPPSPITACEVTLHEGALHYGDEIAIHFEVSPRAVGRGNLAISRLEAMVAGAANKKRCIGKDLVIAALPPSLGLVTACRFRSKTRDVLTTIQERVGDRHGQDIVAMLRELDNCDSRHPMPQDPYLTDSDRLVAGRFLLGNFQPANHRLALRNPRRQQKSIEPGWALGLCDFKACCAILEESVADIARFAHRTARRIPVKVRDHTDFNDLAITAAALAIPLALAGFLNANDREEAERADDLTVVRYVKILAKDLLETIARSQASADTKRDQGAGGANDDVVDAYHGALGDKAHTEWLRQQSEDRHKKDPEDDASEAK